jgi:hypothetical protein
MITALQKEIVDEAVQRIYRNPDMIGRKIVQRLAEGPMSREEVVAFLQGNRYKYDVEVVSKEMSTIRRKLRDFYRSREGFSDPWRIEITSIKEKGGRYELVLYENRPPKSAGDFWAAHLSNNRPTSIIPGRPEFVRETETGVLLRIEMLKGESSLLMDLLRKSEVFTEAEELRKVQPYIAISDVRCAMSIYSYLDSWRRDHGHQAPQILEPLEGSQADNNIVAIGTPFDNDLIWAVEQEALNLEHRGRGSLFLEEDGVTLRKTMPNGDYRVWVCRRWRGARCETLVNASSSEVLLPICNHLTSDEAMAGVIGELAGRHSWSGFPRDFKIQFRVRMGPGGQRAKRIWVQQYVSKDEPILVNPPAPDGYDGPRLVPGYAR